MMQTILKKYARPFTEIIIISLFSFSLWQLATASWIQGKAVIAQQLLNYSWQQTVDNTQTGDISGVHKPWPWADTWPVAKLIVPQYGIEQIILAGDGGNSLAFGPGLSFAAAKPNTDGTTMISAHRDTHFSFLKDLRLNEIIYIETVGQILPYQVNNIKIVDTTNYILQTERDESTVVLVTCYPFEAISAGGPMRYLVFATLKQA